MDRARVMPVDNATRRQLDVSDDERMVDEDLVDEICEEGEVVYTYGWDGDSPGHGSGSEDVYSYRGKFYASVTDGDMTGPYETVKEAIASNELLYTLSECVTGVDSALLEDAALIDLLDLSILDGSEFIQDGFLIEINGRRYEYRKPASLIPLGE